MGFNCRIGLGEEIQGSSDTLIARSLCTLFIKERRGKFVPVHAMKACGGVKVYLQSFLFSELDVRNCLASCPGRFTSGENVPGTRLAEGRAGDRAGLDVLEGRDKYLACVSNRTTIRRKPNP